MKTILITCALSVELNIIKQKIKSLDFKGIKIDFLLTWVGNYNVIYNLKDYIEKKWKPDFLINIWVCWKVSKKVSNDFFQVYRIKNRSNSRESLIPIYFEFLKLDSILSSEEVITSSTQMFEEFYVDMESYGVDYIADKEKIACMILKKPFDIVWMESKNVNLDELKVSLELFNYEILINTIQRFLLENNKNILENLEIYKKHFKFSFSEFEIFKKNYNKLIAYDMNFSDFFEKNKTLNKKEFLKKINEV